MATYFVRAGTESSEPESCLLLATRNNYVASGRKSSLLAPRAAAHCPRKLVRKVTKKEVPRGVARKSHQAMVGAA